MSRPTAIAAPTRRLAGTGATVAPLATTLKAQPAACG
jgi:hypothetical protein